MLHTITRAVLIYTHIYIYIHCVRKIQSLVKHTDHGEKKKNRILVLPEGSTDWTWVTI